jgi:hypothetical protein
MQDFGIFKLVIKAVTARPLAVKHCGLPFPSAVQLLLAGKCYPLKMDDTAGVTAVCRGP